MRKQSEVRKLRIVIKVGTSTLTHENGKLNIRLIDKLVSTIVDLRNQNIECVLVSSGAIGVGKSRLNKEKKNSSISEKQAFAAIGQGLLMHIYEKKISEYGNLAAQLLLTKDDIANRKRFLNARNTINELLKYGVIPIINENDTVSIDEIKFGDNDNLAALVAVLIDADLVVLLTDIDGLYTDNPSTNPSAKKIDIVDIIDERIESMAGAAVTNLGTGGMITKIQAAKIAVAAGIPLVIANGQDPYIVEEIIKGKSIGTRFNPVKTHMHSRKSWILFASESNGKIIIDDGAVKALLENGKSLLPKGVVEVEGDFNAGDVVEIYNMRKYPIAKGISNFGMADLNKIKGLHTSEVSNAIDAYLYDVVIHRDNLGLL